MLKMEDAIRNPNTNVNTIISIPTIPDGRHRKNKIGNYFLEYCQKSGIHGVTYLAEKRSIFERLFWGTLIVASIAACGYMINRIYKKYEQSPVIVSFATKESPIFSIPFPAVTICPVTKSHRTLLNYTELINKARKMNLTSEEARSGAYMSLLCENGYIFPSIETFTEDFFEILDKVKTINIRGIYMEKLTRFVPIITDEGICGTFNMLDRNEIFRDNVVHFSNYHKNENKSKWNIDEGYSDNKFNTIPRRALPPGAKHSLKISLSEDVEDTDHMCSKIIQGFRVALHTPHSIPRLKNQYFHVPLYTFILAAVQPKMVVTSQEVKKYNPRVRECYLSDEKYLKYFKIYTQENCKLECLTNYTSEKCGCVAFFMPRDNSTSICGNKKQGCVSLAEDELLQLDITNELNTEMNKESRIYCDCMPVCSELTYEIDQSQTEWNWNITHIDFRRLLGPSLETLFRDKTLKTSRLHIFFKTEKFWTTQRNELYGPTDLIANFGGLLGLFTGFSLLSLVEIIYFFTLRIFCNIRRYKVWTGHRERELKQY